MDGSACCDAGWLGQETGQSASRINHSPIHQFTNSPFTIHHSPIHQFTNSPIHHSPFTNSPTMISVLLLNTTYEPLHVVSLRRAVALVLQEKAQLVEASERTVRSPSLAMPEPLVIRLRGRVTMLQQRSLAHENRGMKERLAGTGAF
jgi:hypothetical protein